MNNKIKEIAEQLGLVYCSENGLYHKDGSPMKLSELEQFAELLITECAELTLDYKNNQYYTGWLDYRDAIRAHFDMPNDNVWVIKKVPNTKDDFYVESGNPPQNVLDIYGIKVQK